MFGISFSEALLIFLILLLVVGPKQLPVVCRNLGRFYKKLNLFIRQMKQSIDDSLYDTVEFDDQKEADQSKNKDDKE